MQEEKDKDVQEFMDEIVDDLGYTPKREQPVLHKRLSGLKWVSKSVVFAGAGILLMLVIIVTFSAMGSKLSREDLSPLQGELDELKDRIIALESVERRLSLLEKQTKNSIQSAAAGARTSESRKGKTADGKIYHTVAKGDTLSDIGKKYGVSAKELSRLNGISLQQTLRLGQKLLVKN